MADTGARPFVCKDCGRAFSRQDSLLRHARLHNKNEYGLSPSSPPSSHSNVEATCTLQSAKGAGTAHIPWADRPYNTDTNSNRPPGGDSTPASVRNNADHGQQLDFDLIWPDAEDLFHTITSPEHASSWNMPLGALPLPAGLVNLGPLSPRSPDSFADGVSSIGSIPLGGSHSAVHGVSKMITGLVRDAGTNMCYQR
jgi:hypothetical protein